MEMFVLGRIFSKQLRMLKIRLANLSAVGCASAAFRVHLRPTPMTSTGTLLQQFGLLSSRFQPSIHDFDIDFFLQQYTPCSFFFFSSIAFRRLIVGYLTFPSTIVPCPSLCLVTGSTQLVSLHRLRKVKHLGQCL